MACYVYFIGTRGSILIGVGGDPEYRLTALQEWNPWPLVLLGREAYYCAGEALKRYRELCGMFKPLRIHGGWFRINAALAQIIDSSSVYSLSHEKRLEAFFPSSLTPPESN